MPGAEHFHNSGVIVGNGGTVNAELLATGTGATATKTVCVDPALQTLREEVARLVALVEQQAHRVDPGAKEIVAMVSSEAAKAKPNKLILSSLLDGTANALKSVASIGSAALAIKSLIAAL